MIVSGTGSIQNFSEWTDYLTSITSVIICNGITAIGNNAFGGFSNITSVTIPSSVTSIGNSAFSGCSKLTSIEIPASVRTIGNTTFANCAALTKIVNHATTPQNVNNNVFNGVNNKTCMLYVPDAAVKAYSTANGWKLFNTRSEQFAEQTGTMYLEGTITGVNAAVDSITVHLYIRDADLLKSTAGYTLVASILVPTDGSYKFENLPQGVYIIQIVTEELESPPSEPVNLTGTATGGSVNFAIDPNTNVASTEKPNVYGGTTDVESPIALEMKVYPNPTNGLFTLEVDAVGEYVVTIRDIAGRVLLRQTQTGLTVQMDISGYPAGLYLLTIDSGKQQSTIRIVKD